MHPRFTRVLWFLAIFALAHTINNDLAPKPSLNQTR